MEKSNVQIKPQSYLLPSPPDNCCRLMHSRAAGHSRILTESLTFNLLTVNVLALARSGWVVTWANKLGIGRGHLLLTD
jgi:hypothetical protein